MAKLKDILGEDIFKQLSAEKQKEYESKDLEDVSNGAFIPKKRFDEVNDESKAYKKQVGERDTQLKEIKDKYKDVEGLSEKVTELENANKTQKEEHEKQLAKISFNNALEKGLSAYNIKDKDLILAKLNLENLKVDGDNIIGLKEQIEPLKTSHDFLFEKEVKGTGGFNTGGGSNNQTTNNSNENIATTLGKQHAEAAKAKSILDFANNK